MKKVLVACFENWDTLQEVPFVLKKGGCTVDVFCSKKSWLIANSYYDKWIECSDDKEAYIKQLFALAENEDAPYDWIIPADEKLLQVLNERITCETLFYKILPLTKIENREIMTSNEGLSRLCDKYGITSPKYIVYDHKQEFDASGLKLQYPVLLKQDLSWGGGGILFCANEAEFNANLQKTDTQYKTIIQEFITGKDIGVEALFCRGELVEYNAGEVTVYFNNRFNFTTRRNYFNSKRIAAELTNIGRQIGINGFASIQFIYKPGADTYYLLEVDIRPNIWLPYGRFTGHDFSEAVKKYFDATYLPANNATVIYDEKKLTPVALFYRDIIRCVKQKDVKGFTQWVLNYQHFWRFIPTYDHILFKRILNELFITKVKKSVSKMFGSRK